MKELIEKDEYGIFADAHYTARVDSLYVAEFFEKDHKTVLRNIDAILSADSGFSPEFGQHNFVPTSYVDQWNRRQRCYAISRDGFIALAMGFTGKKAAEFKELYIRRFNEMDELIRNMVSARQEFPLLMANIRLLHENPKPYHFSNECDMLNRIVLGMSAKQFRLANGIGKGKSIRPYLSKAQSDMLEVLQKVDAGLLVAVPGYEQRKRYLEWYKEKCFGGCHLGEGSNES